MREVKGVQFAGATYMQGGFKGWDKVEVSGNWTGSLVQQSGYVQVRVTSGEESWLWLVPSSILAVRVE